MAFPQGQRVLVVGGSAGLGRHLAEAFTLSGAHIGIVARRTAELELAADLLRGLPHGTSSRHPRVETFVADVTRDEDVVQLASQVQETFGGIDVVIHCVGRSSRGRAAETKPANAAGTSDPRKIVAMRN